MDFFKQVGIIKRDITPLDPEIVFRIGNFPIASSTLMIVLIALLFLVGSFFMVRRLKLRPSGFQIGIEMIYEQIIGLVQQITNSEKHAKRIFPVIGAMLVYLVAANLISIIPGLTEISFNNVPIFRSPTSDFNTTFGLALGAIIVINFISIRDFGVLGYIGKFFRFKEVYLGFRQGIGAGFVAMIDFFVGLLDIIGEVAKVVSLALRLFGNMYAGQVLMIILFGAVAWLVPALWLAMNIFTGVLQAMVFVSLVAAYYMLAVKEDEGEPVAEVSSQ